MSRLLPLALLSAALALPAGAEAACGVPASRASFETPEVQVHPKGRRFAACYRPTGQEHAVGYRWDPGSDASYGVVGILGGRWLHVYEYSGGDDYDSRASELFDLRTGTKITAVETDEDVRNDVVVLPGALVSAGRDGVVAQYSDGHSEVLDPAESHSLASSGARVYWKAAEGPRTAIVSLPAAEPARPLPRAHRIGRCTPRKGARLVLSDEYAVVTRKSATTYACSNGRTRRVGTAVTDVLTMWDRRVVYARPGFSGVIDIVSGKRRELEAGGPLAATSSLLLAGSPTGLRMWREGKRSPTLLAPGPATDVALHDNDAYWLDGTGAPRLRVVG
jgi:hypothetical protein